MKFTDADIQAAGFSRCPNGSYSKGGTQPQAVAGRGGVATPVKVSEGRKTRAKSYNESIVKSFFAQHGIQEPLFEYVFHDARKWRFDMAWPERRLYLEVDGGIWISGGHNRGAQMKKDWEKQNNATILGWRPLKCEPKDLLTDETARNIRLALA